MIYIGRVVACDPPSLLTDRGAYVNFLEVNNSIIYKYYPIDY